MPIFTLAASLNESPRQPRARSAKEFREAMLLVLAFSISLQLACNNFYMFQYRIAHWALISDIDLIEYRDEVRLILKASIAFRTLFCADCIRYLRSYYFRIHFIHDHIDRALSVTYFPRRFDEHIAPHVNILIGAIMRTMNILFTACDLRLLSICWFRA